MAKNYDKEIKVKIATSATASAVNLALGVIKLYAGVITSSVSILSDGVNNFADVASNAGAAVGFSVEKKKATEKYPFGFGRAEYVVTFAMAVLVVVVGGVFAYESLDRIFYHPLLAFSWTQFGIIAGTIGVKLLLAVMFWFSYKKFPSEVLKAQILDSILDALVTTFALLGLFLSRYISFPIDAFMGIVISVMLIAAGIKILVKSFRRIMCARDDVRTDGLIRLSEAQSAVEKADARVYDFGKNYAEANVALRFRGDADEREIDNAKATIVSVAERKGIKVTFVEFKEEQ